MHPLDELDALEAQIRAAEQRGTGEHDAIINAFAGCPAGAGWMRARCPLCLDRTGKEDRHGALGYHAETGTYKCHKCGLWGVLPIYLRASIATMTPSTAVNAILTKGPVEQAEGYIPLFTSGGENISALNVARQYLTAPRVAGLKNSPRGLSEQACAEAGIGAALWGRLKGRIIVPFFHNWDPHAPWVGWVARDLTGTSDLKYRYAKNSQRRGYLYNEPALYVETTRPVYVVEGTLDAVALWPDAVAVLGKVDDEQAKLLTNARRPVVVCMDGDAWREGRELAVKLKLKNPALPVGNVRLAAGVDPDEVERAWLDDQAQLALARAAQGVSHV